MPYVPSPPAAKALSGRREPADDSTDRRLLPDGGCATGHAFRHPYDEVVPDAATCARCGADIGCDADAEYRHRFILNDQTRSTFGDRFGKLCPSCWHGVERFIEAGDG